MKLGVSSIFLAIQEFRSGGQALHTNIFFCVLSYLFHEILSTVVEEWDVLILTFFFLAWTSLYKIPDET